MSTEAEPTRLAISIAEEVLRAIYGDDYKGCNVSPTDIATVIQSRLQTSETSHQDLVDLYEKVVEAIHLLSTPPDSSKMADPTEVRALLSQRLDGIHAITSKTIQTTNLVRSKVNPN